MYLAKYFRRSEEDINEEELLAVVSGTAEQGLSFLGNLFQLTFGGPSANASANIEDNNQQNGLPTQRLQSYRSSKVAATENVVHS